MPESEWKKLYKYMYSIWNSREHQIKLHGDGGRNTVA